MRITGQDLACGMESYYKVDKIDSSTLNSPKDGQRRKRRPTDAFAYPFCYLLPPHVYISLRLLCVRDMPHAYYSACDSELFSWRY